MERKIMRLFLVGLLMVASLTESEACKKCGNPLCHESGGFGGHPLLGGGFRGHPLLGGGFGGHPMLGGGFGGHPMLGEGLGGHPLLGGEYGGYPMFGGQAAVGYPIPYPVAVPVPVAAPYSSPHHEFRGMGPINAGYFVSSNLSKLYYQTIFFYYLNIFIDLFLI